MAKVYTYTLEAETHFGQTKIAGGTVVANMVVEHDCIDPTQVLSMAMYRQISVQVTDLDPNDVPVFDDSAPSAESVVSENQTTDEVVSESVDVPNDAPTDAPIGSDLHAILDEKIVAALEANGLDTQAKLREFIASGKDMSELKSIGPVRVKTIIAAISNNGLTPV